MATPEKKDEKKCPFWQKPCSEANKDCNFWVTLRGMQVHPMLGTTKNIEQDMCLFFAIFQVASTVKLAAPPMPPRIPGQRM